MGGAVMATRDTNYTSTCPTCGKVRYITRAQAKRAARHLTGKGTTRGRRLRVYACGAYWHLTSLAAAKAAWHRRQAANG